MGKGHPTQKSSHSLLTSQSNRTEVPSEDGIRCGKWLLQSTCVRRRRGQPLSLKFEPSSPTSKRKRRASSPTPSANSFTGENSVQVIRNGKQITMSSSGIPPYELEEDFSDDDDLLELETLDMMERDGKQKIPQRTCPLSGQEYTTFLLTSNPQNIKDILRVDKHTFRALAVELVRRGLLEWNHKNLTVEESLAIFLYICGQNARDRVVADRFQRSLDTISKHFNIIRRAICNLTPSIIRPPNLHETPPEILHDGRYYPWFKDCVGAIDGTHIDAWVLTSRELAFCGRKSTKTQNVMAVCSFDMKFTYVYPGWEGSAHDGRVFFAAVSNPDYQFPHPPINKYYVVDSGYTNMPGYLAPYRGQRYHRDEWDGANTIFRTPYELFNYKHSSLRNVIERCFGVLKKRFPILKGMPNYDVARQPTIVTACCVIHNFILMHHGRDEYFDGYNEDVEWEGENDEEVDDDVGEVVEPLNTSRAGLESMARKRDEMAIQMWDAY